MMGRIYDSIAASSSESQFLAHVLGFTAMMGITCTLICVGSYSSDSERESTLTP
jgi:hypothetical protein